MSAVINEQSDAILMICFVAVTLAAPIILAPIGAGYPDLLQKFAIFGIFAIGPTTLVVHRNSVKRPARRLATSARRPYPGSPGERPLPPRTRG